MPEISRFYGIVIAMYFRDHEPAHFHALYGDYEVTVAIGDGTIEGRFPKRALALVVEWYERHRVELEENWRRVLEKKPLEPIEGLK